MNTRPDDVCLALAAIVGVVGGVFDLRSSHRIPNYFTYSSAACGIVLRGELGGWRDLLSAVAAAMGTFFFLAIFYRLRTMGGGDVKLMTAVAAFAAMDHVFLEMFCTALAGGMIALGIILWKRQLGKRLTNVFLILLHHFHAGISQHPELSLDSPDALTMPYGTAIAVGSMAVLVIARGLK
jgi:prepilin peptidase CpaA